MRPQRLQLLCRTTSRPRRPRERDGVDYHFVPKAGFLRKILAGDFVHIEEYEGYYFGIDARHIIEAIHSVDDGIIMSGTFGASKLKATYGANIATVFVHTGTVDELFDPRCLESDFAPNVELRRRLRMKVADRTFSSQEYGSATPLQFIRRRMQLNVLDLAFINGRHRSGEPLTVIENTRDCLDSAVAQFLEMRGSSPVFVPHPYVNPNLCFVLMPFRPQLKPVYDHMRNALREVGLDVLRADGIFSNRPVMDDIVLALRNARIVVADLTRGNPNVFYETGICVAMGKEVVLITQDDEVPFDLMHLRHVLYKSTPQGMSVFERRLVQTVLTALGLAHDKGGAAGQGPL